MHSAEWAMAFRDGITMGVAFRVGCEDCRCRGESGRCHPKQKREPEVVCLHAQHSDSATKPAFLLECIVEVTHLKNFKQFIP